MSKRDSEQNISESRSKGKVQEMQEESIERISAEIFLHAAELAAKLNVRLLLDADSRDTQSLLYVEDVTVEEIKNLY